MNNALQKHSQKIRFAVIGVINTGLDFGLLFLLTHLGMNPIVANYFSTGVALIFSFFANRSYTFKSHGSKLHQQLIGFFIVTLIGLWIFQPIIIFLIDGAFAHSGINSSIVLLIGKLLASVVTLTWNYIMYARFVFKPTDTKPEPSL